MKVKGVFTAMSGSLGGVTAAHNAGGQYLRARSPVTNPNTAAQQRARSDMTTAVGTWHTLTAGEQNQWNDFASQQEHVNTLGDPIHLSGFGQFVSINSALAAAGLTAVTTPPVPNTKPTPPAIPGAEVRAISNEWSWTNIPGQWPLTEDDVVIISVGRPVSPGVRFYAGPYTIGERAAGDGAPVSTLTDALDEILGAGADAYLGKAIPIQLRAVRADGQFSAFFRMITPPVTESSPP